MKNLKIEDFIENTGLSKFKKEYLHEVLVKLTDENGSTMYILNIFEDVLVRVDGEDCGAYAKRFVLNEKGEKVKMWVRGSTCL